ncbi:MAG: response regulator [Alphaproteobacteria bacterium]|nr:response regulator [Alphaproteobacteria bacterium]
MSNEISLERLSIMVVEDNSYIRGMLKALLHMLGFGKVIVMKDGEEAIKYFSCENKGNMEVAPHVDLILSDLVMTPIDGTLLLRWVRSSKHSPDRFIPFIMISGAADKEYVTASRDIGVTEFIAKPFSVQSLSDRIISMIQNNRQFICSQAYFGPDRRRKKSTPPKGIKERRRKGDVGATIVYSADKIVKPKNPSDLWLFRLPNKLKEKIGGANIKGALQLPVSILEEAEESLERQSLDFAELAQKHLFKLSELIQKIKETDEVKRFPLIKEINMIAHELRGQGGTFGYPLITIFGKSLYEVTKKLPEIDDSVIQLIKAHSDSMNAVIREKIAGDGGELGRVILKSLDIAIKKYSS